jgi:hypothetical protein
MTTIRELITQYENDVLDFGHLLHEVATRPVASETRDWVGIYRRAEQVPDDDAFFWVESAQDLGVFTAEQVELIYLAELGRQLRVARESVARATDAARVAMLTSPASESAAARLLGVDRMTIRRWLGKR